MSLLLLTVVLGQSGAAGGGYNPLVDEVPPLPVEQPQQPQEPLKRPDPRDLRPFRMLASGGGGVAGAWLGLAITYWLTVPNPALDSTFSNAAAATLFGTGFAFSAHGLLGGKGQPLIAALGAAVVMGLSSYAASFIDSPPRTAIWAAVIGCIPVGLVTSLILELTQGDTRRRP